MTVAGQSTSTDELSEVLSEFARTMVTDFPIQDILDRLVSRIVEIMPITAAGVTLISPSLRPRYVAASSQAALRFERLQTELREGPCLVAFGSGEAIASPDLGEDERFPRFAPAAVDAGLRAVFTFPLRHGDQRPLGALDLYRDAPGPMSADAMRTAQTLADVAAAYLINAQTRDDLEEASVRSRDAALHDALTGLPNRLLLLERLNHAILRGRRSTKHSVLLFVDLDRFKEVNDTHGHKAGDDLLIAVAHRLLEVLRPSDTLARLSGDEFVILCEDLDDVSEVQTILSRIEAKVALPFDLPDTTLTIAASIGVSFTGRREESPEQLLREADLAMYRKKRRTADGRRPPEHGPAVEDRDLGLEEELPSAARRDQLHLVYQPIVTAADGRLTGAEALLRWTHPVRGPIPPGVAVSLAERTGRIVDVGRWVLEHACSALQCWQSERAPGVSVSVNVSAHQLMSVGFADSVGAALATTATDPRLVTLELTESVFLRDRERALLVLRELKEMGLTLALDDFGTGYSSLSYLSFFPVDVIKIDREFVANLGHAPASTAIVTAVVQLAHHLGMTVVAEGVETVEQHHELIRLGCDACQGFHFARPLSAPEINDLIRRRRGGANARLPSPLS